MNDDRITQITKDINRLSQLCLNIANLCDRAAELDGIKEYISDNLGLGYRALSVYLRKGVKSMIDFQDMYSTSVEKKNIAELGEQSARDFMTDIFGDEDIDSINDKDKVRIRDFVQQIYKEWDCENLIGKVEE